MQKIRVAVLIAGLLTLAGCSRPSRSAREKPHKLKLYWFIPDGFRADPEVMRIYDWAKDGTLPNLRKMMERGSYGYSIPVFPSHTPVNYASLLTGSTPVVHGIADGAMRTEGYPLSTVSKGGFSSVARLVPPIWYTLEEQNSLVALLSVPGSTPPELNKGITIRGRWGGWGLDFPAVNFQANDEELMKALGNDRKVFGFGSDLTHFTKSTQPKDWKLPLPKSYSPPVEVAFTNWGETVYGYIYDSTDNGKEDYDRILFSKDKATPFVDLRAGEWSGWLPVHLTMGVPVDTEAKIKVIKLGKRGFFRVRFFYDNLNESLVKPSELAADIKESIGPMVDFVDNYPPQLIYYPEDKTTFLEEAKMSLDWHKRAASYLIRNTDSDVVIESIYTPNQFMTSRWWLGYLDPKSPRYSRASDTERKQLWTEMKSMYQGIDAIIGEILKNADDDTYVVLSSDHGAIPLYKEVRLNNLFAREGLLKFKTDPKTHLAQIDWKHSKVVFLQMNNVYINPRGLAGPYHRAHGKAYEKLRERVIKLLSTLKADDGSPILAQATKWEDANFVELPKDRVGDLIIANAPGYGWTETMSPDLVVLKESLKTGYKQAILPQQAQGLWTPFVIMGPGVKKGYAIPEPIRHIDQYPTIMKLLGKKIPSFVQGKPLQEVLD